MAKAKPKTPTRSRTAKSALSKKKSSKFMIWMGVIIVAVVLVAGIVIIRLSQAATFQIGGKVTGNYYGVLSIQTYNSGHPGAVWVLKPIGNGLYSRDGDACTYRVSSSKGGRIDTVGSSVTLSCYDPYAP